MSPKVKAFLDLIGWSEFTSRSPITQNDGYDIIVTGIAGPSRFSDYSDHPFANGGHIQWRLNPPAYSTAAGRYQILARYWNVYKGVLNLRDFSPASQDAVALQMIKEKRALPLIEAGDIEGAIKACCTVWASFPGNDYGQGGHSMTALLTQHQSLIGEANGKKNC
jgi:muramidase (phage lysozyme)